MTNLRLGVPDWKRGDRIWRGRDTLEVVEVRAADDLPVLVVRSGRVPISDELAAASARRVGCGPVRRWSPASGCC